MTMAAPLATAVDPEEMPDWVRDLIEGAPAISTEQAKRINAAFMEFRRCGTANTPSLSDAA